MRPITCYDGWRAPGWVDYIDEQYDTEDLIDESQLKQSREILSRLVDAEVEKLGGDASKVLLLGFSQGGNMAYDVALGYPLQLAGLIARRTSLRNETALGVHRSLPIVHFHGEDDDGIGCNRGKAGVVRLQAAGFHKCTLHTQPGLNHTDFSAEEMRIYASFILGVCPQLKEPELPAELHGRCYCGAVTFSVRTDAKVHLGCYCHCESCRRAHAAPLVSSQAICRVCICGLILTDSL